MKERTNPKAHRGNHKSDPRKRLAAVKLRWTEYLWRHTRRVVVFVVGCTVVLIGVVMLVLPGPGTLVIPLGLAILATEFAWAAWLLKVAKQRLKQMVSSVQAAAPSAEVDPAASVETERAAPLERTNSTGESTDFADDADKSDKQ